MAPEELAAEGLLHGLYEEEMWVFGACYDDRRASGARFQSQMRLTKQFNLTTNSGHSKVSTLSINNYNQVRISSQGTPMIQFYAAQILVYGK